MEPRNASYAYVWEYTVSEANRGAFEEAYGPSGTWVELFRRAPGYVATELHRDREDASRYLTIDYWESEADWQAFRERWADEFEELDARCELLTTAERQIARLERIG